ncbi:kinase-like domain-containing protein [Rhizoctonia solani]|nr:kinase-like domain-containing protein [Rhizoctonia solani]
MSLHYGDKFLGPLDEIMSFLDSNEIDSICGTCLRDEIKCSGIPERTTSCEECIIRGRQCIPFYKAPTDSQYSGAPDLEMRPVTPTDYSSLAFSPLHASSQIKYLARGSSTDVWICGFEDSVPTTSILSPRYVAKVLRISATDFDDPPKVEGEDHKPQAPSETTWSSFVKAYRDRVSEWATLAHSNVIQVYDHHESLNLHVQVCYWGSVRNYLKIRPEGMRPKTDIVGAILHGFSYLHNHHPPIIHGSLNAGKVFVDHNHHVKIGEFSLTALCYQEAPRFPSITFTGFSRWMGPELLDIDPDDDVMVSPTTESDVWALGCTLFEILAEELPYSRYKHDIRIQRAILGGGITGLPH